MPDVLSLGVGGGSLVRAEGRAITVGPDSVGFELTERSLVFGGDTLTATDVAVAAGMADLGEADRVAQLEDKLVVGAMDRVEAALGESVDRMKTSPEPIPVVCVGGGSILVRDELPGASEVLRPDHFPVANAIGAAIAQVGGEIDRIFTLDGQTTRQVALDQARQEASQRAVDAGAVARSVEIVDVEEVPLAYLPSNAIRIRVKAVGDLAE